MESQTVPRGSSAGARGRRGGMSVAADLLERGALPLLLVAMILLFSVLGNTGAIFRSHANVKVILGSYSVTGLIALGLVVPLIAGYFDISVAAVAGMANVAMASAVAEHGASIPLGILIALQIHNLSRRDLVRQSHLPK